MTSPPDTNESSRSLDEIALAPFDLQPQSITARLREISAAFLKLGLISFGGPVAHLSYLRAEFVTKRRWLDDEAYGDLVALCQFLPGPSSSQVVFALGMQRAGILGALAASFCFTLPSALLMIGFAYGVASLGDLRGAGWLHGLKLTAVAVVAQAVWGMGKKLCPDRARVSLCVAAAAFLLACPGKFMQIGIIAAGAFAGWLLYRGEIETGMKPAAKVSLKAHIAAALALLVFGALLLITPLFAASMNCKYVALFDSFYRSGALVFGGGHVMLPLLRSETVPRGWLSDDQFLAGYGAVQAVPGPLSSFAGYLGTTIIGGPRGWIGGVLCLFAIFLPAWLLIGGALPFWNRLRSKSWTQAGLRGANAAVVGVLLAALYTPVYTEAVKHALDVAAVLIAFGLLEIWKLPPWVLVLAMAAAGQWIIG
jgi:chromate transporter